tara:strand:- start:1864 stop:2271 length:408 start_codon:yes stop_codon:yes gene_type:complete
MITSGSLKGFENSTYNVEVTVNSPLSGFEFSLMETGDDGGWKSANMVSISGKEGYLFDQSGNFFGGYESGVPFNLKVYYDYNLATFSYYHEDVLMANSLDVTGIDIFEDGVINLIMFDKHDDSSLSMDITGSIRS